MSTLMVIKTTGLKYDDRLRKECLSLNRAGRKVSILSLEKENLKTEGFIYDKIPFDTISLMSRKIFPQKKYLFVKTLEMYYHFLYKILIKKPRVLWVHNIEMSGILPIVFIFKKIGIIKNIVWDQHELPSDFILKNKVFKKIFKLLNLMCDSIIVANEERKNFLVEQMGIDIENKYNVIKNYVDYEFMYLPRGVLPSKIEDWLNGSEYFLAQGGAAKGRNIEHLIQAVVEGSQYKLLVVGSFNEDLINKYNSKYGDLFNENVFFTGMVPQLELVNYIDNAIASIILYSNINNNNWLCAPNRLYQALSRKTPVLTGVNPPMAKLVSTLDCGLHLSTDGSEKNEIIKLLHNIEDKIGTYKSNIKPDNYVWDSQDSTLLKVIK